ncbi:hypothetical protein TNCV_1595821 [Trichonephila clavipes]|nr:hypothetical protein TNCV_1595821 [Trichonephila clavipes]
MERPPSDIKIYFPIGEIFNRDGFQHLIPIALGFDSIHIENVQCFTTAQKYDTPHNDSFVTRAVDFCYVGEMKVSSNFTLQEKTRRESLCLVHFDSSLKKTPPPSFLWCSRQMFSASQYSVFPTGCRYETGRWA